jgi:hypothetical protein
MTSKRTTIYQVNGAYEATLNITGARAGNDSLLAALDQVQQCTKHLPASVMISRRLPESYRWMVLSELKRRGIPVSYHDGDATLMRLAAVSAVQP